MELGLVVLQLGELVPDALAEIPSCLNMADSIEMSVALGRCRTQAWEQTVVDRFLATTVEHGRCRMRAWEQMVADRSWAIMVATSVDATERLEMREFEPPRSAVREVSRPVRSLGGTEIISRTPTISIA